MAAKKDKSICRFKAYHDIVLLQEVIDKNPYAAENQGSVWDKIVQNLNEAKLFPEAVVTKRTVKERVESVVGWFETDDHRNRIRSGTEEQYTQLDQLLTDISSLIKGAQEKAAAAKTVKDAKAAEIAKAGKLMRAAGENGRVPRSELPEEGETVDDNLAGSGGQSEKEAWMKDTGLDERDWEEHSAGRKQKERDEQLSTGNEKKMRCSRSAAAKDESMEIEKGWMDLMRDTENKRFALKEKKHEDDKEIRLKELELEKMRLEVEKHKWDALLAGRNFGLPDSLP